MPYFDMNRFEAVESKALYYRISKVRLISDDDRERTTSEVMPRRCFHSFTAFLTGIRMCPQDQPISSNASVVSNILEQLTCHNREGALIYSSREFLLSMGWC